jgi:flagellar basal-body rod protein FlgB
MGHESNVIEYLQAGLRAAALRGKVSANNIANLNTPGYRRYAVRFEKVLAEALASGDLDKLRRAELPIVQPRDTPVGPHGNDVDLDREVGGMIESGTLYKTYVRLMAKAYQQMELAMGMR